MKNETLLYGLRRGETERYSEQLLSTNPAAFNEIKRHASKHGWHSFRIATCDLSTPLNPDTLRSIKEIRERGYYTQAQTLGEGGWPTIANEIANWKTYRLYSDADGARFDDIITARNDMAARKAFRELYHLPKCTPWHISEEIKTQRIIAISD